MRDGAGDSAVPGMPGVVGGKAKRVPGDGGDAGRKENSGLIKIREVLWMRETLAKALAGMFGDPEYTENKKVIGIVGGGQLTKITIEKPDGTIDRYEAEQVICLIDEGTGVRIAGAATDTFTFYAFKALKRHLSL